MTWTNGRRTSPFESEIGDKLVLEVIALSIVRVSTSTSGQVRTPRQPWRPL
jgi:hypothetical protein